MLTQTTQTGTDVELGAAVRVTGETEAEAGTGTPGTSTVIANVEQALRMTITNDTRPRVRRLAGNRMRHGGSSRICIPIGENMGRGISLCMWEARMEVGGQGVEAVSLWKGA